MTAPAPPPSASQVDPDSTAELPVLDPASADFADAAHVADASHVGTDTWILHPVLRAPPAGPDATQPGALTAAPPTVAGFGAAPVPAAPGGGGGHDVRTLEAELETTLSKLRDAEQLAARQLARLQELEGAHVQMQAAQAAAEERAAAVRAELTQREGAAEQQAARLEAATRACALAEQRAVAESEELNRTRQMAAAASEQTAQLQRRLEQHETATRGELARQCEQQQALTAQAHAYSARLIEDLHLERARSASCLESLQTLENRRQIAEGLTMDLQREIDARHAEQLAGFEQQSSALSARLAERDAQLRESQREVQALQASVARVQQEAVAGDERVRALEARLEQQRCSEAERQEELQRLRTQRAELDVMLATARADVAAAAAQSAERDAALASERERSARLEAALAAERERATQLEGDVTTMTGEMEMWGGVLKNAQQERNVQLDGIHAAEERARSLEQEAEQQRAAARALQADCDARAARIAELEADLRAAEESIHRLEADAGRRSARIEALEKANEQWRAAATAEAARPREDSPVAGSVRAERHATAVRRREEESSHPEPAADGSARLLIHSDGERDIVHVLGRKTSIGRTPDNDLQIEGRYISRHHAVILAGPTSTIIEDLNSTNGVLVNGRPIVRQTLQDGDQVTIGRTLYRFAVRRAGEKR